MRTNMNTLPIRLAAAAALLALPLRAADPQTATPLRVLATVPTYAALAREIGGDLVDVTCLCRPTQDVHGVSATPSLVERIRDADLLLYTGLDLELWLPPMLRSSGNIELLPGSSKAIEMSAGVQVKEVPALVDRSKGDVHGYGNPHVWTDPLAVRTMAGHVRDAFVAALPEQRAEIEARHKAFHERLTAALVDWLTRYAGLKGKPLVVHHISWIYFLERFGLVSAGALEPKPRVAPTASHLAVIIELMQAGGVKVILREPWQTPDSAEWVAERTGATALELTTHPDPFENGADIIAHFERNLATLAQALGVDVPASSRP